MVVTTWSDSDTSSSEAKDEKSEERANLCLVAQYDETEIELHLKETCSRAQLKKKRPWYMDSGCSRHMTGDEMLFAQLDKKKGGIISFGDDSKGRIHGIGTVAQEYNQEEGIDYDETFALVARIEAIRLLLAFACFMNFKLYQMDVKSAFLNGFIQEEVYVEQPPGFEDFEKSDHVYKLYKVLYGLKQASRACITLGEKELEDFDDYVENGLNVYLNGKEFVVTVDDLGSLLKIECEKGDPQIRILHYFVTTNIQGRNGSLSYISLQDIWLMEHAFNGVALNIGKFMIEKMRGACKLDKVNLPYGNVITSLVKKKGVWAKRYEMDMVKTRDQAIYYGSLIKMGYKLDGEKFTKTPEVFAIPAPTEGPSSQFSSEMIFNLLMRIDGKLTDQGARLQKIEEKLAELENELKEKEKPSKPTAVDSSETPSASPTQQGAESSSLQVEGSDPHGEEQVEKRVVKEKAQKAASPSVPKVKVKSGKEKHKVTVPSQDKEAIAAQLMRKKTMATKTAFLKRRKSSRLVEKFKPALVSSSQDPVNVFDKSAPEPSPKKSSPLREPSLFPLNPFYGTESSPSDTSND
ncbi:Reverse transcriptase [Theobroma cacao]|nr:Reverse transcriptase [Theobroma cacao]